MHPLDFYVFGIAIIFSLFTMLIYFYLNTRYDVFYIINVTMCVFIKSVIFFIMSTNKNPVFVSILQQINVIANYFIGANIFMFSIQRYKYKMISKKLKFLIFLVPGLSLITFFINRLFGFEQLEFLAHLNESVNDRNHVFYVVQGFNNVILIIAVILTVLAYRRSMRLQKINDKINLLVCVLPTVGSLLYFTGLFKMDLSVFFTIIASIIYLYGIFVHNILENVAIVREYTFDSMKEGIIVIDNNFMIKEYNNSSTGIFPGIEKFVNCHINSIKEINWKELWEEKKTVEFSLTKEESVSYYRVSLFPLEYSKQKIGSSLLIYDITKQRNILFDLEYLSTTDLLTDLYNRRQFFRRAKFDVGFAIKEKQPISLVLLDIDFFKKVNDTYMHDTGDFVLAEIAKIIKSTIRPTDFAGRYGGEEFGIVLPYTDVNGAYIVAEKVRNAIANNIFCFKEFKFNVTVSMGVAKIDIDKERKFEEFMSRADLALYEAKNSGRNKVLVYDPDKSY